MKKKILALSLLAAVVAGFTSCSKDELSCESVIKSSKTADTEFDKWLHKNFLMPYNIQIQWRYEDNESDMSYYDIPADSAQSVELAHIIKYTCIEAYTEAAGIDFTRRYFPKLFSFLGSFEYENNGNIKTKQHLYNLIKRGITMLFKVIKLSKNVKKENLIK